MAAGPITQLSMAGRRLYIPTLDGGRAEIQSGNSIIILAV